MISLIPFQHFIHPYMISVIVLDITAGVIVLAMIGKLFIETNFEMIYVVTAEIYPTTSRVTALGMGSALARAAGALAPYVVLSVSKT